MGGEEGRGIKGVRLVGSKRVTRMEGQKVRFVKVKKREVRRGAKRPCLRFSGRRMG